MADTLTLNYSFTLVQVGASRDTWGDKLNANFTLIDTTIKAVADSVGDVSGKLSLTGGTMSGALLFTASGAFSFWDDPVMDEGRMFLTDESDPDPTSLPGHTWYGYVP